VRQVPLAPRQAIDLPDEVGAGVAIHGVAQKQGRIFSAGIDCVLRELKANRLGSMNDQRIKLPIQKALTIDEIRCKFNDLVEDESLETQMS
jgi:hypothetical protein